MWLDPKRYEIVDDKMAEVLRRKTPAERLEMAHSMWRLARDLVQAGVAHDHPEWSTDMVQAETARRMLRGSG
jgi:hypothetical protein